MVTYIAIHILSILLSLILGYLIHCVIEGHSINLCEFSLTLLLFIIFGPVALIGLGLILIAVTINELLEKYGSVEIIKPKVKLFERQSRKKSQKEDQKLKGALSIDE